MIPPADFQPLSVAKTKIFWSTTGVLQKDISVTKSMPFVKLQLKSSRTNYVAWRRQFTWNRTKMLTSAFHFRAKYSQIKL